MNRITNSKEDMSKKNYFAGHEVLFQTNLFGKEYFWMKDVDGTIYLVKAKPVFAGTGDSNSEVVGYAPDYT